MSEDPIPNQANVDLWPALRRKQVLERIAAERERQVEKGWTPDHDVDRHESGELAWAAVAYAAPASVFCLMAPESHEKVGGSLAFEFVDPLPDGFTDKREWDPEGARLEVHRIAELVRAAAFIVAEIERLDRLG